MKITFKTYGDGLLKLLDERRNQTVNVFVFYFGGDQAGNFARDINVTYYYICCLLPNLIVGFRIS